MPSFGIFGSKKKSKSTLTLAGDKWRGEGERSSYSLETEGHNRKMISKLGRINDDLEERNVSLEEENNLLKLKVEILLDMLAQKTAECDIQEAELERLRHALHSMAPTRLALI